MPRTGQVVEHLGGLGCAGDTARLDLDDDSSKAEEVETIVVTEEATPVVHAAGYLSVERDPAQLELDGKRVPIDRFQKPNA
jgi:hypothetical protein